MSQKFTLHNKEYNIDNLSENAKYQLQNFQFVDMRLQELQKMHAVLLRAKNSYIESLKQEMLSDKAGFLFGDK